MIGRWWLALVGVVALSGFGEVPLAVAGELPRRPNLIVLLLDDQDAFTPMWEAMPATEAMMRQRSLHFQTAFAPTPICTPGRVTLLSGQLAQNTGTYTLFGRFPSYSTRSFAVELSQRGYVGAMLGKGWGAATLAPGWDYWCSLGGSRLYEGYGYEVTEQVRGGPSRVYSSGQYSTDFLADKAVQFLRGRGGAEAPFFLWLAPTAPHLPLAPAPQHAAIAASRWRGRLPKRPNFNERNVSDKSAWLRGTAGIRSAAVAYAQGEYHKRMGSLLAVDEMMARIRETLEARGEWRNTIVIITSDNGYNLGAHRLIHKMAPYEESLRVPLVIAGEGIEAGEIDRIVGLHDLAPTLIELAGGVWPGYMDGKSLVPFLRDGPGSRIAWRTSITTAYNGGAVQPGYSPGGAIGAGYALDIPTYRSLRTETHKYIRFAGQGEELYDLRADPFELNNLLAGRRRSSEILALRNQLRARLAIEMRCSGAACP
jgi:arylsulfatase A-like enzyme